jgi:DnaJ-class molecular chaperone
MKYLLLCLCLLFGCGQPGYYEPTGQRVTCGLCQGSGMRHTGNTLTPCMRCGGQGSVEGMRFVPTAPKE